jgi:hypothetical protein
MIKVIINKTEYQLKNSYDEVTFKEYLQLLLNNESDNPNLNNIHLLSGITKELINDFVYNLCLPHIEFIEATELFRCDLLSEEISSIKVGEQSFLKLETAKMIIKNNGKLNAIHCIIPIIENYTGKDLANEKIKSVLPIANHFILELETFFNSFKKLNEYKPSPQELAAGLKQLDYLGFYATLDALTHSDITKREQVKEMAAFEVYNQLLVDYEKAMFQKRLSEQKK